MDTATGLTLRLRSEERDQLIQWLTDGKNVIGKTIEVEVSSFHAGLLGKFICEIKEWKPPTIFERLDP